MANRPSCSPGRLPDKGEQPAERAGSEGKNLGTSIPLRRSRKCASVLRCHLSNHLPHCVGEYILVIWCYMPEQKISSNVARARCGVCLALPAYNEAENLPSLLLGWEAVSRGLNRPFRVVVVDDGSRDNTADVLRQWGERLTLQVVPHTVNQGLGRTIADALRTAVTGSAADDVVVTMDADNTHPPELFPHMLALLDSGEADVVIASRYRSGSQVIGLSFLRLMMSWGARILFQAAFPIPGVRDYTCGYRAYRAWVLQEAIQAYGDRLFEEKGFQCMADILIKISRLPKVRFGEVPLVLRYDRKGGISKMKVLRTVWHTLHLLIRRRLGR